MRLADNQNIFGLVLLEGLVKLYRRFIQNKGIPQYQHRSSLYYKIKIKYADIITLKPGNYK